MAIVSVAMLASVWPWFVLYITIGFTANLPVSGIEDSIIGGYIDVNRAASLLSNLFDWDENRSYGAIKWVIITYPSWSFILLLLAWWSHLSGRRWWFATGALTTAATVATAAISWLGWRALS